MSNLVALPAGTVITFHDGAWHAGGQALSNAHQVSVGGKEVVLVDQAGVAGRTSIQSAVDQAGDGATILIAPGIYLEQVVVEGRHDLTISGNAGGAVTIRAPGSLATVIQSDFAWSQPKLVAAVVAVDDSTDVELQNVLVDGSHKADQQTNGSTDYAGIFFNNSSGAIAHATVTGVRVGDDTLFGLQKGQAILCTNDAAHAAGSFGVSETTIADFQKNGIVVRQADVTLSNNRIDGVGSTGAIAQNGMDLGQGVTGRVSGNAIGGIGYGGADTFASGILTHGDHNAVRIHDNAVTGVTAVDSFAAIAVINAWASLADGVYGNTISHAQYGIYEDLGPTHGIVDLDGPSNDRPNTVSGDGAGYVLVTDPADTAPVFRTGTAGDDAVFGAAGADYLAGGGGNDALDGGDGDDVLDGGDGQDALDGGDGIDEAVYRAGAILRQDASGHWTVTLDGITETLAHIEKVTIGGKTHVLAGPEGFTTIQQAVDAAQVGDVVNVAAGAYNESVSINKAVTLAGAMSGIGSTAFSRGRGETVLAGIISVTGNGAAVDGFTIDGGHSAGISINADNVRIANTVLVNREGPLTRGEGLLVQTGHTGVSLTGNTFSGWQMGVLIGSKFEGTVADNFFTGNGTGLSLLDTSAAHIVANVFLHNVTGHIDANLRAPVTDLSGAVSGNFFGADTPEVTLHGLAAVNTITGTAAADVIDAGEGNDRIGGDAGNDTLLGRGGDDTLDGGLGDDVLNGAAGNDFYRVDSVRDVVVEGQNGGIDTVATTVSFALGIDCENLAGLSDNAIDLTGNGVGNAIVGNAAANRLSGLAGDDNLSGGAGQDRLSGDSGNDTLWGGAGHDMLNGGAGRDILIFNTAPNRKTNVDRIVGFSTRDDTIELENMVFKKLGKAGKLAADAFHAGKAAADSHDRIIYDRTKGALYYDADGTGHAAQVLIAQLDKKPLLTKADFFII